MLKILNAAVLCLSVGVDDEKWFCKFEFMAVILIKAELLGIFNTAKYTLMFEFGVASYERL